jgi:metal-dependent HD superfamily phosphatase/phosphodiesterase
MNEILTFEIIKNNIEVQTYLEFADKAFALVGRIEHGILHALYSAETSEHILKDLGYSAREQELAKIAAYVHDIGSMISKYDHDQSSAIMFLNILGEDAYNEDVFAIASAVGCHEDKSIDPVSPIAAALILGDKVDMRSERIRTKNLFYLDKYSRVLAACKKIDVVVSKERMTIVLRLVIDIEICSVMDYFEVFTARTNYCRKASSVLGCSFELYINEDKFL